MRHPRLPVVGLFGSQPLKVVVVSPARRGAESLADLDRGRLYKDLPPPTAVGPCR